MLKTEDRNAIEGLFERIDTVSNQGGPRDPEAERLIGDLIGRAPAAPYYMAQTILVQEHALQLAEQRIAELEEKTTRQPAGGGFLGGLFGGGEAPASRQAPRGGPWDREARDEPRTARGGGGFLAGAAQTALGVTGGVLLGSAIAGLMTGGAEAAPYDEQQAADEPVEESGGDDGGGDDFDMGGEF